MFSTTTINQILLLALLASPSIAAVPKYFNIDSIETEINNNAIARSDGYQGGFDKVALNITDPATNNNTYCVAFFNSTKTTGVIDQPPSEWVWTW